jgi:predicted DNA-binding transcriptional regulator AlpA
MEYLFRDRVVGLRRLLVSEHTVGNERKIDMPQALNRCGKHLRVLLRVVEVRHSGEDFPRPSRLEVTADRFRKPRVCERQR